LFIKGNVTRVHSFVSYKNATLLDTLLFCLVFIYFIMNICCRYASLYFCMCIDDTDNELEVLEMIHHFVEILDRYFGSVSSISSFDF
jgi:hypothetical protein